jgi:hypothetical protein
MLIQRKTTDLLSSIPHLKEVLGKMLDHTPRFGCWLLFIGDLSSKDGEPMLNGQPTRGNMSLQTMLMTQVKWQLRGGYVAQLKHDGMVPVWITGMMNTLEAFEQTPEILTGVHKPTQTIITNPGDRPWRATLASLPGIGDRKADDIAKYAGTLANAFAYLSDPTNSQVEPKPAGIGLTTFENIATYMGLDWHNGERLMVEQPNSKLPPVSHREPPWGVDDEIQQPF